MIYILVSNDDNKSFLKVTGSSEDVNMECAGLIEAIFADVHFRDLFLKLFNKKCEALQKELEEIIENDQNNISN